LNQQHNKKFSPINIKDKLKEMSSSGILRVRKPREGSNSARIIFDNKEYLSFASNDYLGLSTDQRICSSMVNCLSEYGLGTGSSPLISGYTKSHMSLEKEISDFLGQEKTILFSTGYQANLGIIKSLVGRNETIFSDKLNHASIIDGAILSRAKHIRYQHLDLNDLDKCLHEYPDSKNRLVITDALFSMDGDIAPLKDISHLQKRLDFIFLVDEAHTIGVSGKSGKGIVYNSSLNKNNNICITGTFGKAFGTFGAFFSGSEEIVNYVLQKSRSYIYSTSIPTAIVEATRKSLEIIKTESWRREKLSSLIYYFTNSCSKIGLNNLDSSSHIQPIIIGDPNRTIEVSNLLLEKGIYSPAIRYPTVARDKSRLRISLNCNHQKSDIDMLLIELEKIIK